MDLSEEEAKAYRLADNKLNETGWDMPLVVEELKELSLPLVEITGFEEEVIKEEGTKDVSFTVKEKFCPNCKVKLN